MLLYQKHKNKTHGFAYALRCAAVHLWTERSANAIKYKLIYAQSTKHKYFHLHKITKAAQEAVVVHKCKYQKKKKKKKTKKTRKPQKRQRKQNPKLTNCLDVAINSRATAAPNGQSQLKARARESVESVSRWQSG